MYAYRRRKKAKIDYNTMVLATGVYLLFVGLLSHALLHLQ